MTKDQILDRITRRECYNEDCSFSSLTLDADKLAEFLAKMTDDV